MENTYNNESDFIKIILILKKNLILIFSFVLVAVVISIYASLQLPNKYRSDVKIALSADDTQQGLGALAGQFGGLASLAGINLGGKGDVNLLIDTLKSRSFLKKFIAKHNLFVELFAVQYWDVDSGELIIDPEIYNANNQQWLREVEPPKQSRPTLEEAYEKFGKIISVNLKRKTNLITVSVTYYSPEIAQQWLDLLIIELSEYLRKQDQQKALDSIEYLTDENTSTEVLGIQSVLSELLEQQYQKVMLTKVRKIYGFDIRDDSYIPEEKDSPKRAFIVIGGAFVGGILALAFIFIRLFLRAIKDA
jgi:uncharacterized protein involved in exopolysaccharide biosynthesis